MHKHITPLIVIGVSLWTLNCSAAVPSDGKPTRLAASEKTDQVKEAPSERRQPFANRFGGGDPAQIVSRMIQQFDQDGDEKLDVSELTALFEFMRERAGNAPAMRNQRPGARPDRQNPEVGGDKPQRPQSE